MLLFLSMLQTDDERALLTDLYLTYRGTMFRIANKYLNCAYDAEDVVHDVFKIIADDHLSAVIAYSQEDRRRFLFVCTRNRALNLVKRRAKDVSLDAMTEKGFDPPDGGADPIDQIVSERYLTERAKEAVKQLDPIYGEALWMHLMGFTAAATAKLFGEDYELIKKRMYRAKLQLKNAVLGEGGEE